MEVKEYYMPKLKEILKKEFKLQNASEDVISSFLQKLDFNTDNPYSEKVVPFYVQYYLLIYVL